MKRIKAFALLLGVVVLASCASQKRVIYLQDTQADEQIKIAQDYQIRIKPLDRLTVVVNSRDPELAAPFNTSTSLNSLTGTPLSTYSSNSASLQIRTVDENGDLDMPIIGPMLSRSIISTSSGLHDLYSLFWKAFLTASGKAA